MNISEKIKVGRENKGWTQADLSKYSGVSLDSIKRYESKVSNITIDNLIKIADSLEVDLNFFRDDEISVTKSSIDRYFVQNNDVQKSKSVSPKFTTQNDVVQIPIYKYKSQSSTITYFPNIKASAGYGIFNENEESIEIDTNLPSTIKMPHKKLDMIQVQGDSMQPYVESGDFALIERSNEAKNGDIVIANYDDDLYIKQLQKNPQNKSVLLISSNNNYPSFEISDNKLESLSIIGILRGVIRVY